MRFSVLLPTRNRLKYLRYAVNSILEQDYEKWEIIISDNDSQEDIFQYVESLNDSRVKYYRTSSFVSVTENWNNAINRCSGDYVIMLGDDDILLRDYFSTMIRLLEKFNNPNMIYANAYIYAYPGVIPEHPEGSLHTCKHYPAFNHATEPFWLTKEMSMRLVQGHLNFKAYFGTNMQFILIKQSAIEKIKINKQFFYSPYPDVYAMCRLMLETDNILVYPNEVVVIGVTPKSTGNFLVNNDEKKGMDFLNISKELKAIESLSAVLLPGSYSLTCWLTAMETVKLHSEGKHSLEVKYERYRLLQIEQMVKGFFSPKKTTSGREIWDFCGLITTKEKLTLFLPLFSLHFLKRFCPSFIKRHLIGAYNKIFALSSVEGDGTVKVTCSNIFEIFEQHVNGKIFSKQQIEKFLERIELGKSIPELCEEFGIPEAIFHNWKAQFDPNIDSDLDLLKEDVDMIKVQICELQNFVKK